MEVLYEDEDVVVINKPAGLVVHSDGRTQEPSVAEWLVSKYPSTAQVGEPLGEIERPGVVHRIDRETSGALILAKTKRGHEVLKKQFQNRDVEKIYHLFVYGNIKEDSGVIDLPISRSKKDFRQRVARLRQNSGAAKQAITEFKVLKRASDKSATFLEAKPKTGRTHQLRAHFRALYHPIIADSLYASKRPKLLGFERLALHARKITFKNVKGEKISTEATYPEDFKRVVDMLS